MIDCGGGKMAILKKYDVVVIVLFVLFLGLIFFLAYITWNDPFVNKMILLVPPLLWMIVFCSTDEYLPKNFCNPLIELVDVGVAGTFMPDETEKGSGGMKRSFMYVKSKFVPEKYKREQLKGFRGFLALMSRNIRVSIEYHQNDAKILENGTLQIYGWGFCGEKMTQTIKGTAIEEVRYLRDRITLLYTKLEKARAISDALSKASDKDVLDKSQKLAVVLKDISEGMMPTMMPKAMNEDIIKNQMEMGR